MARGAEVKPEFGPTLPQLLDARVGGVPRQLIRVLAALTALIVALAVIAALRGGASTISGGGSGVSFSFDYKGGLVREANPRGGYALLESHASDGRLIASIAVSPLRLPPYRGDVAGIEPIVAANSMSSLAAANARVLIQSAGPTLVDGIAGYNYTYTRTIGASTYFGRVIFLTPSSASARGIIVSLLAQPVLSGIVGPGQRALADALYEPGQGGVGVLFQPAGTLSLPLATLRLSR